jgi:hypothetical protein
MLAINTSMASRCPRSLEAGELAQEGFIAAQFSDLGAVLYRDLAVDIAEVDGVSDAETVGGDGAAGPPGLRCTLKVDAAPPVEAVAATIIASPVSALLVGAVGNAIWRLRAFVLLIEGVPRAAKFRISLGAVRVDQRTFEALDHGVRVCAGALEIHGTTGVAHTFTDVGVAELESLAGPTDSTAEIGPADLVVALGLAGGFVTQAILSARKAW